MNQSHASLQFLTTCSTWRTHESKSDLGENGGGEKGRGREGGRKGEEGGKREWGKKGKLKGKVEKGVSWTPWTDVLVIRFVLASIKMAVLNSSFSFRMFHLSQLILTTFHELKHTNNSLWMSFNRWGTEWDEGRETARRLDMAVQGDILELIGNISFCHDQEHIMWPTPAVYYSHLIPYHDSDADWNILDTHIPTQHY